MSFTVTRYFNHQTFHSIRSFIVEIKSKFIVHSYYDRQRDHRPWDPETIRYSSIAWTFHEQVLIIWSKKYFICFILHIWTWYNIISAKEIGWQNQSILCPLPGKVTIKFGETFYMKYNLKNIICWNKMVIHWEWQTIIVPEGLTDQN